MPEDNHDDKNDTDERKPLLTSSDQQVVASSSPHNSADNAEHRQKQNWFATSPIKKISFALLLCVCPLLLCWCGWQTEQQLKHVDTCIAAPTLSWSSVHTIDTDRYNSLRVGHEITDRLHITGGLVQVQVNDQASEPTVRFNLKLTDASQSDLIQIKQITQSDNIAILIDASTCTLDRLTADAAAENPSCIVLDILVELPNPTALDELVIETSDSAIEIDDGMYFSRGLKLATINGNITMGNSPGNVVELNTHAGHIECSIHESPAVTQITARSTTGKLNIIYTGVPSSSNTLVDQQRSVLINLTTVSGDIHAQMSKVDNLVYDVYRQFHSGAGQGSSHEVEKFLDMLNHTISEGPSLFDWTVYQRSVWGSADISTVHLVARSSAMHTSTHISFCRCENHSRSNKSQPTLTQIEAS
ncbi:hypothetical protein BDB00DRAFT_871340 [Zychaea mexicana]|uniref:uncharacterized protein n=1 Tax=Zychaea mexicana TaxID=64656 RepID=UPI0022FEC4A7|nr:uncharacterized protein BDB00DRAFT_871340 [Zychaea mexicana]KAI9494514.1 hypothetical protein BDB00DRAFT_871340 [Zychaea mexicana]